MPIFVDKYKILVSNHKSDIIFAKEHSMKEINKEDQSREEYYLYDIISACECILDDMENGAKIEQADFNNLGYVDGIMFRMSQNISKQLNPSNIKGGHYPTNGKNHLMDE